MGDVADFERDDRPSTAQPAPVQVDGAASVHDLVIADLAELVAAGELEAGPVEKLAALLREGKAFGLAKYGTVLQVENGRDASQDVLEEVARDGLVYAFCAREQGARGGDLVYRALRAYAVALADAWYQPPSLE